MSEKRINSHIQMPRCVLKRFENEHHSFFYYDVEKNIIGNKGHAKTINTQIDYYSSEVERYLSENVEALFSKVLQLVDRTNFNAPLPQVNNELCETVKSFVYALIARDPTLVSKISAKSVYFQFLQNQNQHDFAVKEGIFLSNEKGFLDSYGLTFSINISEEPFVLPMCGIYSYVTNADFHINLPISPQIAITLMETKEISTSRKNECIPMYLIEKESIVEHFNKMAFRTQCNTGWGFIVSPEKNALEKISIER